MKEGLSETEAASICPRLSETEKAFPFVEGVTLLELRALKPLLKHGGALLGDDWVPIPGHVHFGVMQACHTFMRETDFDRVAAGPGRQWCLKQLSPSSVG